jgi:hypothetical protein
LIQTLAPQIVGRCNYFAASLCTEVFSKLSSVLFAMLLAWATRRHPKHREERGLGRIYNSIVTATTEKRLVIKRRA